ncbi:MAG: S1 RNA-binding domain-containing protein [Nitrospirae bacterium]|nr:S1 RNA-binding domain-containing protein [Nitrospirota bacterium]
MSENEIETNPAVDEDRSGDAAGQEESFASLLEKSGRSERLAPGQKVKAKVVSISGDLVYIDLGGKSEGTVNLNEFVNGDGIPSVKVGDEIEAFFVNVQDGVRRLTTMVRGYSPVSLTAIRDAFDAGLPVNGEVKREVKGGFEVSVGGVRCFCPFSQIDLKGGREGGIYLGRTFPFKVLEYEENGKNVILSRRAILEEEKQARVAQLRETLQAGMDLNVPVTSIQKFGAFVDLGGIDGLIPASEISWDRSARPGDVLAPGQTITARILSLDWESNRLTLSIKATQPDPWAAMAEKYPVDSRVSGTITRLAAFGAFVMLDPGIEGLIHISNLGAGRRINHPKEVVEAGQLVEAYVLAVDVAGRKISLSIQPRPKPQKIVLPESGIVISGVVEKVMPYGVFLKISEGLTGLIPNAEMGTPAGTDHRKMFPAGTEIQVMVTDVDATSNKVRLSRKAVLDKETQSEYHEYVESARQTDTASGGLGSLGDILRAKLEEKKTAE